MMPRRNFVRRLPLLGLPILGLSLDGFAKSDAIKDKDASTRPAWLAHMQRMATPVLQAIANNKLHSAMKVETDNSPWGREPFARLEAFARLLCGIAPWLELDDVPAAEAKLQEQYRNWARAGIENIINPDSPDYGNFKAGPQILVDSAFLAQACLRAPTQLFAKLKPAVQQQLVSTLQGTRQYNPYHNNWVLFSAMVEAFMMRFDQQADYMRMELALRKANDWYVGDGHFADGLEFHLDYYNSYVIHPFMLDIYAVLQFKKPKIFTKQADLQRQRSTRYAAVQERMIMADGSFPATGRSLVYRTGAFHALAQAAYLSLLPKGMEAGSVRAALWAVVQKTLEHKDTYRKDGYLNLGLVGKQPSLAEPYICTGSLYLAAAVFMPMGLPAGHPFWVQPASPWTNARIWGSENLPADKAYVEAERWHLE